MLIYLILLIFTCTISINLLRQKISINKQKAIFSYLFIFLLLLIIFRSINVGTDYIRHYDSFIYAKDLYFLYDSFISVLFIEPVWKYLFYIINSNKLSIMMFWAIYFCLLWFFLVKAVPKGYSTLLSCVVFVIGYFYFASYNTSAQILAAIILMCSIKALNKKKIVNFIALFTLALLIHKSTIIVLPFLILNYINIPKKFFYIAFIISFIITTTKIDAILFSKVNELMLFYEQSSLMSDYNQYFELEDKGLNIFGIIMNYFIIIANMAVFMLAHWKDERELDIYSKFWITGIIILMLTFNYAWLFRLSYFFTIAMIIALPICINNNKKNKCKLALLLLSFIYICKLYNNNDGVVPYEFISLTNN